MVTRGITAKNQTPSVQGVVNSDTGIMTMKIIYGYLVLSLHMTIG